MKNYTTGKIEGGDGTDCRKATLTLCCSRTHYTDDYQPGPGHTYTRWPLPVLPS